MTVIALDMGTKRIGVAVSPAGTMLAMPVDPILRTNIRNDLAAVVSMLEERGCTTLVIGDPITLAGARGQASDAIDACVEKLAHVWLGTIQRIDERLTTAQSNKVLIGADVSRAKRRGLVDGMAAALILESYLAKLRRE
jgi:putative Holliday junction resolvase